MNQLNNYSPGCSVGRKTDLKNYSHDLSTPRAHGRYYMKQLSLEDVRNRYEIERVYDHPRYRRLPSQELVYDFTLVFQSIMHEIY